MYLTIILLENFLKAILYKEFLHKPHGLTPTVLRSVIWSLIFFHLLGSIPIVPTLHQEKLFFT